MREFRLRRALLHSALMRTRSAYRAGSFYPGSALALTQSLEACLREGPLRAAPRALGALIPHAGWRFSGALAARTLATLATRAAQTEVVVLFGAVHVPGVLSPTVPETDSWSFPGGMVSVSRGARKSLLELVEVSDFAHREEHSIEVAIPFVHRLFPEAEVLPVAVPPRAGAAEFGARVAEALESLGEGVVFVGSTDLSHYGPRFRFTSHGLGAAGKRFVQAENDPRMLELFRRLAAEDLVEEARTHRNACGAGAAAATLAAVRTRGAQGGEILGYTTSADVLEESEPEDLVGYAGVLFEGSA